MQRRTSNAKPDCEEKRDPDKRSLIIQKKENELCQDTQLEKLSFAATAKAPISMDAVRKIASIISLSFYVVRIENGFM
jgi:hypothetical protein